MKLVVKILCLALISCFACNKEATSICQDGLEEGRIIGYDFRKCACCSGWWIEVGNDTLRSFILPENIEIDQTNIVDGFDVAVCLSFEKLEGPCADWEELIEMTAMELQ